MRATSLILFFALVALLVLVDATASAPAREQRFRSLGRSASVQPTVSNRHLHHQNRVRDPTKSASANIKTGSAAASADAAAHAAKTASLAQARKDNILITANDGVKEGKRRMQAGIDDCIGKNPFGWFVSFVCTTVYSTATSPVSITGETSHGIHQAVENSHDGKSALQITKGLATTVGPQVIRTTAIVASAGTAAGAESAATEIAQNLATEAASGAGRKLVTGAVQSATTSSAAKRSLVTLKSRVVNRSNLQTPASDVIALAAQFDASGAARVKLAAKLAVSGRVNLGPDANAALKRIGLPVTPLSSVDLARTFLRVKYASGTITLAQWKEGEAQLNDPKVQAKVNQESAKAAQIKRALRAAKKK